ncbi:hypothetical protein [Listeria booriae]|uniref:Uncharacterized protein n=1 Tax=Listeria booriae TaxID=1552123 RepID=A0A842F0G4_9LIST|nr:hypothetical protein [Listeria booriae]MBC2242268.1 hypothetical protein [Listeria booriae]
MVKKRANMSEKTKELAQGDVLDSLFGGSSQSEEAATTEETKMEAVSETQETEPVKKLRKVEDMKEAIKELKKSQTTFYMGSELHATIKVKAAMEGMSKSDWLIDLIVASLSDEEIKATYKRTFK